MSAVKNSITIRLPKKQAVCFEQLPWGEPFTYMGELFIKTENTLAFSLHHKKSSSFVKMTEVNPVNLIIEVLV